MRYRVQHKDRVQAAVSNRGSAIAAFKRKCKRQASRRLHYLPGVSADSITTSDIAYPRPTCARGMHDGHGWVYVDARND